MKRAGLASVASPARSASTTGVWSQRRPESPIHGRDDTSGVQLGIGVRPGEEPPGQRSAPRPTRQQSSSGEPVGESGAHSARNAHTTYKICYVNSFPLGNVEIPYFSTLSGRATSCREASWCRRRADPSSCATKQRADWDIHSALSGGEPDRAESLSPGERSGDGAGGRFVGLGTPCSGPSAPRQSSASAPLNTIRPSPPSDGLQPLAARRSDTWRSSPDRVRSTVSSPPSPHTARRTAQETAPLPQASVSPSTPRPQ